MQGHSILERSEIRERVYCSSPESSRIPAGALEVRPLCTAVHFRTSGVLRASKFNTLDIDTQALRQSLNEI